jgi:hypothetical protein
LHSDVILLSKVLARLSYGLLLALNIVLYFNSVGIFAGTSAALGNGMEYVSMVTSKPIQSVRSPSSAIANEPTHSRSRRLSRSSFVYETSLMVLLQLLPFGDIRFDFLSLE